MLILVQALDDRSPDLCVTFEEHLVVDATDRLVAAQLREMSLISANEDAFRVGRTDFNSTRDRVLVRLRSPDTDVSGRGSVVAVYFESRLLGDPCGLAIEIGRCADRVGRTVDTVALEEDLSAWLRARRGDIGPRNRGWMKGRVNPTRSGG